MMIGAKCGSRNEIVATIPEAVGEEGVMIMVRCLDQFYGCLVMELLVVLEEG